METFTGPDKPMDALLANSPSVRQSGSILHGDFFFRGLRTNGTNFYVNNVPGVFTQFNTPLYPIESLEVLSGPNVGIYGTGVQYETTNPGGIISVKTKVAPDEGYSTTRRRFLAAVSLENTLTMANVSGTRRNGAFVSRQKTSMAERLSKGRKSMDRVFLPISTIPRNTRRIISSSAIEIWTFRAGCAGSFLTAV